MKLLNLSLAAMSVSIVIGAGTVADAIPLVANGTYSFYATDGNTALNGSSVTFINDQLVSWNLLDSKVVSGVLDGDRTQIPLTPINSEFNTADYLHGFSVLGPNSWFFDMISKNPSAYPADSFEGGEGGGVGYLYDGAGDPTGNWVLPDAAGTLQLFACALMALGICKYFSITTRSQC